MTPRHRREAMTRPGRRIGDRNERSTTRTLRKLTIGAGTALAALGAMAAPAAATHGGSDSASCVAWFVGAVPESLRGEVISEGAHLLQPFGVLAVSAQAGSPRYDCIDFRV